MVVCDMDVYNFCCCCCIVFSLHLHGDCFKYMNSSVSAGIKAFNVKCFGINNQFHMAIIKNAYECLIAC